MLVFAVKPSVWILYIYLLSYNSVSFWTLYFFKKIISMFDEVKTTCGKYPQLHVFIQQILESHPELLKLPQSHEGSP
jgi:hypothetical protein